jgi:uncharacterized membrane protein HdeD (DUF308 family)
VLGGFMQKKVLDKVEYVGVRKFNLIVAIIIGIIVLFVGLFEVVFNSSVFGWVFVITGAAVSLTLLEMWQNAKKVVIKE